MPFKIRGILLAALLPTLAQARAAQVVTGHVPAAAKASPVVGRLPAATSLRLAIGLPLRNQAALTGLLENLYDPANPAYRQFITPEQFTEQFGAPVQDYGAVIAFLQTNGFTGIQTHPNRMIVDATASVGDIERAFHFRMGLHQHPKEARNFYAPD